MYTATLFSKLKVLKMILAITMPTMPENGINAPKDNRCFFDDTLSAVRKTFDFE